MKQYIVQAVVTIQHPEETRENFERVLRNIGENQFSFVKENTFLPIEMDDADNFQKFMTHGQVNLFLKVRDAYVKVIVSSSEIALSSIDPKEQSHDLGFYIEVMLCLCEQMLIWSFAGQEVSIGS